MGPVRVSLVSLLLILTSCSSLKKTGEQTQKSSKSDTANDTESSKPERIVGSAKITERGSYEDEKAGKDVPGNQTYYLYGAEHLDLENTYFDIPVVYNGAVKKWINYFKGRGRDFFVRYSARAGRYAPILGKILEDRGMPRDLIFLAMAESGFQNRAKSWAKAVGPWQFMPYTARHYGLTVNWYRDERRDPIKATIAACKYLKKLYDEFGSWELAAAGYNAGEGKVRRAIRRYGTENFWKLRRYRYLKRETKEYVPKIMALAIIGKNLKTFGFDDVAFHDPLDFEEIVVAPFTDLMKLAKKINVPFKEIQRLNPEVMRWFTSPDQKNYKIRVPVGKASDWQECCANEEVKEELLAKDFTPYRVRGTRSRLSDVSRKYKIKDYGVLGDINGMSKRQRLSRGQIVYLPFRKGQSRKAKMYADLYDKPRRVVVIRRKYRKIVSRGKRYGEKIQSPSEYYTVQKGDSLWTVSRKTGADMNTIIASNLRILNYRMIRAGDELVIR